MKRLIADGHGGWQNNDARLWSLEGSARNRWTRIKTCAPSAAGAQMAWTPSGTYSTSSMWQSCGKNTAFGHVSGLDTSHKHKAASTAVG